MKNQVIVLVGISSSGKTTLAETLAHTEENFVIVCRDDLRRDVVERNSPGYRKGIDRLWDYWKFERKNENYITRMFWNTLKRRARKANVIIADTNLNEARRQKMVYDLRTQYGLDVRVFYVPVDLEVALERNKERVDYVDDKVIIKQFEKLKENKFYEEMKDVTVLTEIKE